jgi:uncharacterized membrane protein
VVEQKLKDTVEQKLIKINNSKKKKRLKHIDLTYNLLIFSCLSLIYSVFLREFSYFEIAARNLIILKMFGFIF